MVAIKALNIGIVKIVFNNNPYNENIFRQYVRKVLGFLLFDVNLNVIIISKNSIRI